MYSYLVEKNLIPQTMLNQELGFDGLFDLSPSHTTFLGSVVELLIRRPKCRKGVIEIGNVPSAELSIVQYIVAI
jgi:hypothetical protein